jgi:hypothetical protein
METNPSIGCIVSECQYHSEADDYCTLDKIMVGRTEQYSSTSKETDCESFISKRDNFS